MMMPLSAAADPTDVSAEVLKMLRAGLSEELILEWLEDGAARATRPTAGQLIELKEAGASEALLKRLLALSREPQTAEPAVVEAPAPPPVPGSAEPAPPSPSAAAVPAPPPAPAPADRETPAGSAPAAEAKGVPVDFSLSYRPYEEEDESDSERPWHLFVYLDGRPLSWVPSSGLLTGRETVEFRMRLEPGRHRLRVAQERHQEKRRGRWQHEARFAGEVLDFELAPGAPARVEVVFEQSWMRASPTPIGSAATRSCGPRSAKRSRPVSRRPVRRNGGGASRVAFAGASSGPATRRRATRYERHWRRSISGRCRRAPDRAWRRPES
jgi:hypothetical protein